MKRNCLLLAFAVLFGTSTVAQGWETLDTTLPSVAEVVQTVLKFDSAGTPFVSFIDNGISAGGGFYGKPKVVKYDGSSWVPVGNVGFSSGTMQNLTLALAPNGAPYVAYEDLSILSSGPPVVMKYNGNNWVPVGSFVSSNNCSYASVAIDKNGTPYLAYGDNINFSYKVTVVKFDGTNWNLVGSQGFSFGQAQYTSLTLDNNGVPYVVYSQTDSGPVYRGATVMKFNGSSWVTVGNQSFTAGTVRLPAMVFDNNNTPYVAYRDEGNRNKATVMKYDGNSWVNVGNAGFSGGAANFPSIVIDKNNVPYVAYRDSSMGYRATVMKYDGNQWVPVGSAGFTAAEARFCSLAFDPHGILHIAFSDYANGAKATVMKYTGALDTTHTGISEPITENTFAINPNPSAGVFHVSFTQQVTNVQVYDMQGRLMVPSCNEMDDNALTIDLTGKARGIYFFRASTLNGMVNGKLVLE